MSPVLFTVPVCTLQVTIAEVNWLVHWHSPEILLYSKPLGHGKTFTLTDNCGAAELSIDAGDDISETVTKTGAYKLATERVKRCLVQLAGVFINKASLFAPLIPIVPGVSPFMFPTVATEIESWLPGNVELEYDRRLQSS